MAPKHLKNKRIPGLTRGQAAAASGANMRNESFIHFALQNGLLNRSLILLINKKKYIYIKDVVVFHFLCTLYTNTIKLLKCYVIYKVYSLLCRHRERENTKQNSTETLPALDYFKNARFHPFPSSGVAPATGSGKAVRAYTQKPRNVIYVRTRASSDYDWNMEKIHRIHFEKEKKGGRRRTFSFLLSNTQQPEGLAPPPPPSPLRYIITSIFLSLYIFFYMGNNSSKKIYICTGTTIKINTRSDEPKGFSFLHLKRNKFECDQWPPSVRWRMDIKEIRYDWCVCVCDA